MTVPRAKKPKKPGVDRPARTPKDYVLLTHQLSLAINLRLLCLAAKWTDEEIADYIEAYLYGLDEITSGRSGLDRYIDDTTELTGYDARKLLEIFMK